MACLSRIVAASAALLAGGALLAQPADNPPRLDLSELPPGLALGVRASLTHRTQVSIPVVVIAQDLASYVRAVEGWAGVSRYPVLIDDGSHRASVRIGRFVRAYEPEEIVILERSAASEEADESLASRGPRIPAPELDPLEAAGGFVPSSELDKDGEANPGEDPEGEPETPRELIEALPTGRGELQDRLTLAWTRSMDVASVVRSREEAISLMRAAGYAPPGVVVMDTDDPAWAGGLALASAHLCPIVFVDAPFMDIDRVYSHEQADELARAIEDDLDAARLAWAGVHDEIEAVTLAMNTPAKIRFEDAGQRSHVAMTDRIGRHTSRGEGSRWAWCSQVPGDASESAYRAMCAIFLPMQSGWVFDGYPGGSPWNQYDGTEAGEELKKAGLSARVHDMPDNGAANWRHAVSHGVSADIVLINSKGLPTFFALDPGDLGSGDMPVLERPAAVHLVHSFAFQRPGNDRTVGGRLMAHGAYAAFGAVDEPFLQGFVPTPMFARRLRAGFAWAAAGRVDSGPPWRIAAIGDPLMTISTPPKRGEVEPGLDAVSTLEHGSIDEARAAAVRDEDYATALRLLVMSGRDDDAARLAASLLEHAPDKLTSAGAEAALGALFRERRFRAAMTAYEMMGDEAKRDAVNADVFWNAARARFLTSADSSVIGPMDANLRDGQGGFDMLEIAGYVQRASGIDAAKTYLARALDRATSSRDRDRIQGALRQLDQRP
ncbi:MAG: hypothetical protein RIB60_01025 [Phycisphaerales bacterium]